MASEPHDISNGTRSEIDTKPAGLAILREEAMSRTTTLIRRRKLCVRSSMRTTGTAEYAGSPRSAEIRGVAEADSDTTLFDLDADTSGGSGGIGVPDACPKSRTSEGL